MPSYFFGRERLVAELVARLVGAGFLGIVGPSGSGKSSVLARRPPPGPRRRGAARQRGAGGACCSVPASSRWRSFGACSCRERSDPLAEALDALPAGARLLLAVDQLEELFTACRSEAERAAFADTLARAAADPDGRAVVVVALRADFYGRFAAYPALAELLGANHVLVGPDAGLGAAPRRRAARRPGGAAGRAGAGRRAGRRRRGRAGRAAAAVHRPARALAEAAGQRAHPGRLPRVRRRPRRRRAPGRGHLRPHPRRAQAARARHHAAPGRRGRGRRAGAPPRSARRARPGAQRGRGRRARDAGRQPPRHASARAPSRSPTRRCCASGRACASGSRRTPKGAGFAATSPRRRPSGTRPGATRASSTAAPASPPPSTGPPITRSTLNELEREFVTESREASEQETTTRPAHEPAPARPARRRRGPAGGGRRRRDLRRSSSAARRATRETGRSSPSASAPRRSSRRTSTARSCSPARRSRSTTRRRPGATCSPPSCARRRCSGSCTAPRARPPGDRASAPTARRSRSAVSASGSSSSTPRTTSRSASRSRWRETYRAFHSSTPSRTARTARRSRSAAPTDPSRIDTRGRMSCSRTVPAVGARLAFTLRRQAAGVPRSSGWSADPRSSRGTRRHDAGAGGSPDRAARILQPLRLQVAGPPPFALTPDGRSVVTASDEGELAWWDLRDRREATRRSARIRASSLARAQPGRTSGRAGHRQGHPAGRHAHRESSRAARALTARARTGSLSAPTADTIVSTSLDGSVTLWDAGRAAPTQTLRGHSDGVDQPALQPRRAHALHRQRRRIGDRLGPDGDRGLGNRSRSRTTAPSTPRTTGTPAGSAPTGR